MNTLSDKKTIRTYSRNAELINKRRLQIIKSVERLFGRKGYGQTSTREIANACKMTIGALYYYIGSKEDVLQMMVEYQQDLFTKSFSRFMKNSEAHSNTDIIIYAFDRLVREMDKRHYFIIFLWREMNYLPKTARKIVLSYESNIISEFEKLLQSGCATGEFKIPNIKLVANDILFASEMWALRRWLIKDICSIDEYIDYETTRILDNIHAK
jgi:TetR/AcrR family transcriptional regulator, cholesterol catabolism regulator